MCSAADAWSANNNEDLVVLQVSEAEAMVAGGVANVLVSNEVVSPRKLQRLVALAAQGKLHTVVLDGHCRAVCIAMPQHAQWAYCSTCGLPCL